MDKFVVDVEVIYIIMCNIMVVLGVLVVFFVVFIVWIILCSIICLLSCVVEVVEIVVVGDFIVVIYVYLIDEIGCLLQVLVVMNQKFKVIVLEVWCGIDFMVIVLIQIVIGNLDFFLCIEEQVSVLEEIVFLLEQLIFSVKQNVDYICKFSELVGNVM